MDRPLNLLEGHRLAVRFPVIAVLLLLSGAPALAQVDIATKPLFVTAGVEPNIITAIDDSGSMDSEILVPTNDGALWWHTGDDSFVGRNFNDNTDTSGVLNYNSAGGADGTWKKYIYLFPNGTGTGNRVYSDSSDDHYAVPPFKQFGFVRSADYNGMYYDYRIDYEPWPDEGGHVFDDAPTTAAPSDPLLGSGTLDLSDTLDSTNNNWEFRLHPQMVIPEGTRYYDGGWKVAAEDVVWNSSSNTGVEYYPATYFVRLREAQAYTLEDFDGATVSGDCSAPNPEHYRLFARRPSSLSGVDALAYDGGCLAHYRIATDSVFPSGRTRAAELQNFANWFSYARKRHIATRAGIGRAFNAFSGIRTGAITINSRGSLNGMYSLTVPSEREDFFDYLYRRGGNSAGTPNREALKAVGDFFHTNNGVITESCQQNFALLFTDGFSNVWTGAGVGNADAGLGEPFADSHSNTIADIAAHYYKETLRGPSSGFEAGKVPVPAICANDEPPPYVDCNRDLHMVTYGITLGAQGLIFGNTHRTLRDAHDNPPDWDNPKETRNPVQVDDLYHAAVNSRGGMLNARTAEELAEALSIALQDIADREPASGTSSSTSTPVLRDDEESLLYSVEFRGDDWSGDVVAREVDRVTGETSDLVWSAQSELASRTPASRKLFTHNGVDGVPLTLSNLAASQAAALNRAEDGTDDGLATSRIDWLYGAAVEGLRSRLTGGQTRLIGDIVSSTPLFLGPPRPGGEGYNQLPEVLGGTEYSTFISNRENRRKVLMVSSNDGLFRVLDALTGAELFAYLPGELLEPTAAGAPARINSLMAPEYEHRFYNDGTPSVSDVYINGQWRTVVVGSMGVGGRSIFAIDVTDPANLDESSILWEFSHPDLGYGVTEVGIAPMQDGRFAAVFGNGYNSDQHHAALFIVDLVDGSLIAVADTGVGTATEPNGLAPAQTVAWPERNSLAQYVYAGDLQGNLWVFDVSTANTSKWDDAPTLVFEAAGPSGNAQPITVLPRVSVSPLDPNELMINFGTGSFFRDQDNVINSPQVQTLYGIRHNPSVNSPKALDRSDLLAQSILWESSVATFGETRIVREISSNAYDDGNNAEEAGWYLDLVYNNNPQGERVIAKATFPSGFGRERVRFTSLIPSDNPCLPGRQGFLFDLDLATGGATETSVFDINEDGMFTKADMVSDRVINAISSGSGEAPAVIQDRKGGRDLLFDGEGALEMVGDPDDFINPGRQSWQQVR